MLAADIRERMTVREFIQWDEFLAREARD